MVNQTPIAFRDYCEVCGLFVPPMPPHGKSKENPCPYSYFLEDCGSHSKGAGDGKEKDDKEIISKENL